MSSHLERRQAQLAEALGALAALNDPAQAAALRTAIEAEQAALAAAPPPETTDAGFQLGLLAWLTTLVASGAPDPAADLLAAVQDDPALRALQRTPALTPAAAALVVQLRQSRLLGLADVPAVQTAAGGEEQLDELVDTAMRRRLAMAAGDRPYLYRDVAVLLPLRLETLFDQRAAGWTMLLRVVPDEASIRRDNPTTTPFEIESLRSMWQAIYDALSSAEQAQPADTWLDTPLARVEWESLCTRFGGGRAAWLAAAHPPNVGGGVVSIEDAGAGAGTPPPNRVGGFPAKIEVWAGFRDQPPRLIDKADVKTDKLLFDVVGAHRSADNTLVEEKDRWWVSWPAALDVGLGREILLPNGYGPMDIRVLYVVGLGEENPEEHFRAQIEAGEMASILLGAPTNAVDGAQAASLAHGPEDWRQVARRRLFHRRVGTVDDLELSQSLAGQAARLPALPLSPNIPQLGQALVQALWPALWGHQLRDLWGCLDESDRLARWASRYLRPEGPLAPIRIAEQPYGLLPTTKLSRWRVSAEEGSLADFEKRLLPTLLRFRARWAAVAETRDTAVGAGTRKLLELISRDALSAAYAYRLFLPVELWEALFGSMGPIDPAQLDAFVRKTFAPVYDAVRRPPDVPPGYRHALAAGGYESLEIPLVVPTRWPYWYLQDENGNVRLDDHGVHIPRMTVEAGLVRILQALLQLGHSRDLLFETFRNVLPDSLLIRLLIDACWLSAAAVVQTNTGPVSPLLEPIVGESVVGTRLDMLARQYNRNDPHGHPAGEVRHGVVDGLTMLFKLIADAPADAHVLSQVERAFRATLDTATHRIDPWITALPARRLSYLRSRPEARFRLGVYSWVEGPMIGAPGPTAGGLLHAPSHPQALTSVILRDRYISEALETPTPPAGRNLWSVQLESERIRLAEEMADEVRLGSHIFEVLGRRVEQVAGSVTAVDALRLAYPLQAGQPNRSVVCHGVDALHGLLDVPNPPISVDQRQHDALVMLRRGLDAYGDLLVAEAVHQVVTGRGDGAGAAMDAAAGLDAPPTLDFTHPPLAGESLNSTVISVVPFRAAVSNPDPATPPTRIADASVAAVLETLLGAADQWRWAGPPGADGVIPTTTLAGLGLEPVDTLVLSEDLLLEMVRHRLGVEPQAGAADGTIRHRRARALVRVLGSQAALLRDMAPMNEPPADAAATRSLDRATLDELGARYAVLRSSAQLMIDELSTAAASNDLTQLRQALFRALRWGITPMVTRAEQEALFGALFEEVAPNDPELLPRLARLAKEALGERLAAAPAIGSQEPIARTLAELAAPEGQLAILSRIDRPALLQKTRLDTNALDAALDEEWLPVVASVRPYLARLEALQLEALPPGAGAPTFPALSTWSNAPADHWLTAALADLVARRRQPGGEDPRLGLPRFVAAYTSGEVWQPGPETGLAVGLVDNWGEAVPRGAQTTTAAFGFHAPAARPPQAILLAVPPDLDVGFGVQLDAATLVDTLEETRQLAHARAANAEELGGYLAAVPTTMFQASGKTAVRLDAGTTFPG